MCDTKDTKSRNGLNMCTVCRLRVVLALSGSRGGCGGGGPDNVILTIDQ